MTEPTPNAQGFYLFASEPECRAWMDDARTEGGEDPMIVAVFPPDNMLPPPKNWPAMSLDHKLTLRGLVDASFAKSRGKDSYVGMRYFGFMAEGKPVAGGVQWKSGTMTWPTRDKGPTPAQKARWAARGQNGDEDGARATAGSHAPTPPAAPARTPQQQLYDALPPDHPSLHPPFPPADTIIDLTRASDLVRALPAPTPGFETYEMRGERLIVAAPGIDPVMLVVKDGKIALKKLG